MESESESGVRNASFNSTHPLVLLVVGTGWHGENGFTVLGERLEHFDVGSTVLVEVSSHVLDDTGGIWGQMDGGWK